MDTQNPQNQEPVSEQPQPSPAQPTPQDNSNVPQITQAPTQAAIAQPTETSSQPHESMVSTPAVLPPTASIYPQASMGIGATPTTPLSKSDFEQMQPKSKKPLIMALSAIPVILIIGFATVFFTNTNFKDMVLMKKYREFSYTNAGANYTLAFYKGAKIEVNPFLTSNKENVIVSPSLANGALPIGLAVDSESASTTIPTAVSNCQLTDFSNAFTIHVPAASGNVHFCAYSAEGVSNLIYVGIYTKGNKHYSITVAQFYDKNKATSDKTYARQVLGKLGLTPYQNDLKQFIGTITAKE